MHKTIKKVSDDNERFSFNTSVSTFMIAVNELSDLKCNKQEIIEPLLVLMHPHTPYITEEIWSLLGNAESIVFAEWPLFDGSHLIESNYAYPVSFNGKMRFKMELPLDLDKNEIEKAVLTSDNAAKYLEGKTPKKVIVVPGKIVNIVL